METADCLCHFGRFYSALPALRVDSFDSFPLADSFKSVPPSVASPVGIAFRESIQLRCAESLCVCRRQFRWVIADLARLLRLPRTLRETASSKSLSSTRYLRDRTHLHHIGYGPCRLFRKAVPMTIWQCGSQASSCGVRGSHNNSCSLM